MKIVKISCYWICIVLAVGSVFYLAVPVLLDAEYHRSFALTTVSGLIILIYTGAFFSYDLTARFAVARIRRKTAKHWILFLLWFCWIILAAIGALSLLCLPLNKTASVAASSQNAPSELAGLVLFVIVVAPHIMLDLYLVKRMRRRIVEAESGELFVS